MRTVMLLCVMMMGAGSVQAQTGGYQLFNREGNSSSSPGATVANIPLEDALKVEVLSGQSLNAIVPATVNRAESVMRRQPAANATNAQRETMMTAKGGEVQALIGKLPGTPVNVSVVVEDVVTRAGEKGGRRMVVGRINWQSTPVQTDEDRKALADLRKKYDEELKALATANQKSRANRTGTGRGSAESYKKIDDAFRDNKAKLEKDYQDDVKRMKTEGEAERPVHMIYILGDNEEFDTWRRGQTRNVKGVIQEVGLFIYNLEEEKKPASRGTARGAAKPAATRRTLRVVRPSEAQEDVRSIYVGFEAAVIARTD